ncbi:MAG: hypothetical protein IH583_03855, partial [Candidatus Aminicenantes bacterium]|nr:hypothetical protein [Candidatus Aminicenantes bacterium]
FQGPNAYFALKNALLRQFMHRKFWLNDPDCLLLRGRETELARNERELYALAAGALDNMVIASDKLSLLGPEEKSLFLQALALRGGRSRVSGLLGEDAYVIHSQGGPSGDVRLGVNLSDRESVIGGVSVAPRSGALLELGQGNGGENEGRKGGTSAGKKAGAAARRAWTGRKSGPRGERRPAPRT